MCYGSHGGFCTPGNWGLSTMDGPHSNQTIICYLLLRVTQIAEKEREKKSVTRPDPVDASAPSLDEKVRFTYDLYRTTKVEVRLALTQYTQSACRRPSLMAGDTDGNAGF